MIVITNTICTQLFDRFCQVTHLRALLLSDIGKRNEAITLLQGLLVNADRDQYNRALLWAIVDLAILLRARREGGDNEQAESNFDSILVDLSRNFDDKEFTFGYDEPDPPRLLKLAEKALTLVRTRKFNEVKELFEVQNVSWARPEDLWIPYGGPTADTAWIKGPLSWGVLRSELKD